jgi:hypothetical protein
VKDVTGAYLAYLVHPGHAGLVDEVIDWYNGTAADIERTVLPGAADEFALKRWAAHGYETDPASLGDAGTWSQLNERDLTDVEQPALPDGFRFRTADEAGPEAAVQAHLDAWAPSTYTAEGYQGVRQTAAYRGDLRGGGGWFGGWVIGVIGASAACAPWTTVLSFACGTALGTFVLVWENSTGDPNQAETIPLGPGEI